MQRQYYSLYRSVLERARDQIDYDILIEDRKIDKGVIDNIIDIMVEINMSNRKVHNGVQVIMRKQKRSEILKNHNHKIWKGDDGRYRTFLPDATKEKHRRLISRASQMALEDAICDFYADTIPVLTLKGIYPEWIASKASEVKVPTLQRIESDWKKWYECSDIVDKPLIMLNKSILQSWVNSMIQQYSMTKHSYGNFALIINQMLDYAEEHKYIPDNPFKLVKVNKKRQLTMEIRKPDEEMIFFEDEQIKLIEYCWKMYHYHRNPVQIFTPLAIVFDFFEGVRDCELAALRWEDIDTINNTIYVSRMVEYKTGNVVPRTKGGKPREVPLHSQAAEVLAVIKQKRIDLGLPLDWIFCPNDNPNSTYRSIEKWLPIYCKELGIIPRNIHSVRRTWITVLYDAGINENSIMEWAGHEDIKTTRKSYVFNRQRKVVRNALYEDALAITIASNHLENNLTT